MFGKCEGKFGSRMEWRVKFDKCERKFSKSHRTESQITTLLDHDFHVDLPIFDLESQIATPLELLSKQNDRPVSMFFLYKSIEKRMMEFQL